MASPPTGLRWPALATQQTRRSRVSHWSSRSNRLASKEWDSIDTPAAPGLLHPVLASIAKYPTTPTTARQSGKTTETVFQPTLGDVMAAIATNPAAAAVVRRTRWASKPAENLLAPDQRRAPLRQRAQSTQRRQIRPTRCTCVVLPLRSAPADVADPSSEKLTSRAHLLRFQNVPSVDVHRFRTPGRQPRAGRGQPRRPWAEQASPLADHGTFFMTVAVTATSSGNRPTLPDTNPYRSKGSAVIHYLRRNGVGVGTRAPAPDGARAGTGR